MKKKELLSPAGNMESLHQAVQNGCDAVYLSGKNFGARKFAANFSREELTQAIAYCHLYGVKLYVTVNTLIHDQEEEELLDYVTFLYEEGVDALIMQDLGMIRLIREQYPDLAIHASTQLHNHNQEDLHLLETLGVERAVLARELTIAEIASLKTALELEVFIHGALCICYSGQCLMSSLVLNRSGNRGECAGLCRLPYELLENGKKIDIDGDYLLSPKELNTSSQITKLLELDQVTSLKIEGRMKSPEYVGFITAFYRRILDRWEQGQETEITQEADKKLKSLYHRGFTKGHLFSDRKKDLMNAKSPNHIGIVLGQVVEFSSKRIKIKLEEELNQGDGLRFPNGEGMIANFIYNKKDLLVAQAQKGEVVELDNKIELTSLGPVRKTSDKKLLESLAILPTRKIKLSGKLIALPNQPLSLEIRDGIHQISRTASIVQEAKTAPLSKERIIEQLNKIKETPFQWDTLEVTTENAFVPMKELNELRRGALEELINVRSYSKRKSRKNPVSFHLPDWKKTPPTISVLVRTLDQFEVVKSFGVDRIYVTEEALYQKVKSDQVFLRIPRVIHQYQEKKGDNLLLGEVGGLSFYRKENRITDYFCNAYNAKTVAFFLELGASLVTLSVELKQDEIIELIQTFEKTYQQTPPVSVLVYGRVELMVMKHCLLTTFLKEKGPCQLCQKGNTYELKDRNQERYPLQMDCPYTHIFHYKVENRWKEVSEFKKVGLQDYRVELFDETKEEIQAILSKLKKELN